mgnify:CR=1 FL=1
MGTPSPSVLLFHGETDAGGFSSCVCVSLSLHHALFHEPSVVTPSPSLSMCAATISLCCVGGVSAAPCSNQAEKQRYNARESGAPSTELDELGVRERNAPPSTYQAPAGASHTDAVGGGGAQKVFPGDEAWDVWSMATKAASSVWEFLVPPRPDQAGTGARRRTPHRQRSRADGVRGVRSSSRASPSPSSASSSSSSDEEEEGADGAGMVSTRQTTWMDQVPLRDERPNARCVSLAAAFAGSGNAEPTTVVLKPVRAVLMVGVLRSLSV